MQKELTRTKLSEDAALSFDGQNNRKGKCLTVSSFVQAFTLEAERFSLQTWRTILHFHIQQYLLPLFLLHFSVFSMYL